uniref:Uncharacterized protein n=1 Tax=Zea mays TaxID=4577 RepID=B6SGQ9_MAIZE|nr:hypothetical protein [Zea mays]|eukprot:NP_001338562.1 uncharacterized protein LOC100274639 [Zea mays]
MLLRPLLLVISYLWSHAFWLHNVAWYSDFRELNCVYE